ncbi:MAG: hypothetical protein LBQ63_00515 [Deltaproteobacteria bacterium]|jgi:hypothetical protein|nr:hypothetical protein [Deltaproteobacteria bacterium]
MTLNEAWLDKLAEKQKRLEQELQQLNARLQALGPRPRDGDLKELRREVESDSRLDEYLKKLEAEAAAAGRARAEQARAELDATRGIPPAPAGRGRRGVVRL